MTDHESDVHIGAIRQALADGNAAVMVGSGFSLNAEGGSQLATWNMLCEELYRALNPDWVPKAGVPLPFSTAQVMQLGEQYARVMTQPALEDLLKRMIPNDKVQPGALHRSLLRLPWTEILTTNYDTLLERAAEGIVGQGHFTVVCREDIPRSKVLDRRRIVKLHGSFPSNRPFIFTEEEYRKYPSDFAPFVNLVRQSMLENVLCLIGFSGDDPNFLAWIGWVRDMLDKHALPIYLFLDEAPSLGMRSLLAVRKVIPVVLPKAASGDVKDYAGRYAALFAQLAKPLAPSDTAWAKNAELGKYDYIDYKDHVALEARLLDHAEKLRDLTDAYPGWLIAPRTVRRHFQFLTQRQGIDALRIPRTYERLESDRPALALSLFAMHVWNSDVLLEVLHDDLATVALRLLTPVADAFRAAAPGEKASLARLGIKTPENFRGVQKQTGLGLLRWARERQIQTEFDDVAKYLAGMFPDDPEVADTLAHERALLHLYQGERPAAKSVLLQWRPSNASPYMAIRKGALLAEVGAFEQGFDACVAGLQELRKSQKIRSDRARFLSEEAWGCHILDRVQAALGWMRQPGGTRANIDSEEAASLLEESQRLMHLDGGGHDVSRHLQELIPDLDADIPLPKQPTHLAPSFEVGHYSREPLRLGGHASNRRMQAAFAWLTAADRVGLTPRIGSTSFESDTFVQAAWWTQYWETPRRLIGVATRLMNESVLKPKDRSKPVHATGWLSRNHVARLDLALVIDVRQRFIELVDRAMSEFDNDAELERFCAFHLEVASRLSIRVTDDVTLREALEWAVRIANLPRMRAMDRAWTALANFIARNFEASTPSSRRFLLVLLAGMPEAPSDGRERPTAWFNPMGLREFVGTPGPVPSVEAELQKIAASFITRLDDLRGSFPELQSWLWCWVVTLQSALTLEAKTIQQMQTMASTLDSWPDVPHFNHYLAARLLEDIPGERKRFRAWVLTQPFANMRIPPDQENGRTGWAWGFPVDQRFLWGLRTALSFGAWGAPDARKALGVLRKWWQDEGKIVLTEMKDDDMRGDAVRQRFDLIDEAMGLMSRNGVLGKVLANASLRAWVSDMLSATIEAGIVMFRTRYALSGQPKMKSGIDEARAGLARMFTTARNDVDAFAAGNAMAELLASGQVLGDFVLDTVLAMLVARKNPSVAQALHVCRMVIIHSPREMTPPRRRLLNAALEDLREEATYGARPDATRIDDDDVPDLRLYAARLAIEVIGRFPDDDNSGAQGWLTEAPQDPLPELRHLSVPIAKDRTQPAALRRLPAPR